MLNWVYAADTGCDIIRHFSVTYIQHSGSIAKLGVDVVFG